MQCVGIGGSRAGRHGRDGGLRVVEWDVNGVLFYFHGDVYCTGSCVWRWMRSPMATVF